MNIWKALAGLQAFGSVLTILGQVIKSLGEAITGPNLGTGKPPPDSAESLSDSDDLAMLQDPLPHGGMDEKPEEVQTSFFFIGGGSTEPPPEE